uniref:Uncharacterized protein MANES_16G086100 n=1 Tax=Rhizophora mucronata TaxID=61149 RepID=A0A2P2M2R2_RHIMU
MYIIKMRKLGEWIDSYQNASCVGINIIKRISSLEIVKHSRLIQVGQFGHVVHSSMLLLVGISRKQPLQGSQNLLARRSNDLDLLADEIGDFGGDPGKILVLHPYLGALPQTHPRRFRHCV